MRERDCWGRDLFDSGRDCQSEKMHRRNVTARKGVKDTDKESRGVAENVAAFFMGKRVAVGISCSICWLLLRNQIGINQKVNFIYARGYITLGLFQHGWLSQLE
jgi:hypothetical protein